MNKELIPVFRNPSSIDDAENKIISLGSSMGEHAYLMGKYLSYVKENLARGQFDVWVERKLWFSRRTAYHFISFATEADEKGKLPERTYELGKPNSAESARMEHLGHQSTPDMPKGTFDVIYADPPWSYSNSGFDQSAAKQYPTMTNEEIFELGEKLKVADEAVLFLWVTAPILDIGFQVCDAWGFNYKQNMVWIKNKAPFMGWFVKGYHEHLLIATRGEGMHPAIKPQSYFNASVAKHSEKPKAVYDMIEKMYPKHKYLEMFARNPHKNWTAWGKEAN
jgi:N6-adenosine-specific RNA methylase IME4